MKRVHDLIVSQAPSVQNKQPKQNPIFMAATPTISEQESVSQWVSNGLQLVSGDASVQINVPNIIETSEANWQIVHRNWSSTETFFNVVDSDFWKSLTGMINNTFTDKISKEEVTGDSLHHFKNVAIPELLEFFGIWIILAMEYTPMKHSIKTNFYVLKAAVCIKITL